MRFNLKVLVVFSTKKGTPESFILLFFYQKKLVRLFMVMGVKPSLDSKMIKNFLHLITCSRHYYILAKTLSRLTMAVTFSRQNYAGSRVSNTQY